VIAPATDGSAAPHMSSPLSSSHRHSARLPPCHIRHSGRRPRCWLTFAPPAATKSADDERERHGERRRSLHRAEHSHVIGVNPERRAHEQRHDARDTRAASSNVAPATTPPSAA